MEKERRCWLRWHNYGDSVTSALETLRYDENFLDVTLACDGHTVRAHKLVLSACSEYFRKVLKDHPCDHPIVIVDGISWTELMALLQFMYCGEVMLEESCVPALLIAASNLNITGLSYVTAALSVSQKHECDSSDLSEATRVIDGDGEAQPGPKITSNCRKHDNDKVLGSEEPPSKRPKDTLVTKNNRRASLVLQKECEDRDNILTKFAECVLANGVALSTNESAFIKRSYSPSQQDARSKIDNEPDENTDPVKALEEMANRNDHSEKFLKEEVTSDEEVSDSSRGCNPVIKDTSAAVSFAAAVAAASRTYSSINYAALIAEQAIVSPGMKAISDNKSTTDLSSGGADHTHSEVAAGFSAKLDSGSGRLSPFSIADSQSFLSQPVSIQNYSRYGDDDVQATLEQYQRRLAFHEPRPCPTCKRIYRDAATLRTHMAIMHAEGKDPFSCTCGALFRTKYDMYQHKKNGHY